MKRLLPFIIFLSFLSLPSGAKHLHVESWYVKKYCAGIREVVLNDGTRIDCLTDDFAIEFDFPIKYRECLVQSLEYSMRTGKPAKCILIRECEADQKYIDRAKNLIEFYQLPVALEVIKN